MKILFWWCLAVMAAESSAPAVKKAKTPKADAPKVETQSLPAYQKSVESLTDKVLDDVNDTVKRLNQQAQEIE